MKNTYALPAGIAVALLLITTSFASEDPPRGEKLKMNEINARAARDFAGRFPLVADETWYRFTTGYSVKFSKNDVVNTVCYDRTGFYINTIRYYKESSIPKRLKKRILVEFDDFEIVSATEVITEKESSFHFTIKSKTRIQTVKVTGSEIKITGDYRNAELDL